MAPRASHASSSSFTTAYSNLNLSDHFYPFTFRSTSNRSSQNPSASSTTMCTPSGNSTCCRPSRYFSCMFLGTKTLISRRRLASRDSPSRAVPRALAAEAAGRRRAAAGFFFVTCKVVSDFFVGFFVAFFVAFFFPVFTEASTAGLSCSSLCKACNVLATASSPERLRSIWDLLSTAPKETSSFLPSKAKAGAETFLLFGKKTSQAKTRQNEIGLSLDQPRNDPSGSSDRHPHR